MTCTFIQIILKKLIKLTVACEVLCILGLRVLSHHLLTRLASSLCVLSPPYASGCRPYAYHPCMSPPCVPLTHAVHCLRVSLSHIWAYFYKRQHICMLSFPLFVVVNCLLLSLICCFYFVLFIHVSGELMYLWA